MEEPRNPAERVADVWEEVIADMEATAEEYRERGWDVAPVHPGDVAALDGTGPSERWGLDVLAPDDEFDEVERLMGEEDGSFDSCEVFRAQAGGMVYLVVAMLDEADEAAVVFPAYFDPERATEVMERAHQEGEMRTHLRPLSEDVVVTFTQDDPSLFFPE